MKSDKQIWRKDFRDFLVDGHIVGGYQLKYLNCAKLKCWLLKDKPRYSVAELMKIIYSKEFNKTIKEHHSNYWFADLIDFLRDNKKVREILK